MIKIYRSDALAAIHETASDLHDAGVMGKRTPRVRRAVPHAGAADAGGGHPGTADAGARQPGRVRALPERHGLVSQWERGEKHPAGASLKLLNLVHRRGLAAIA